MMDRPQHLHERKQTTPVHTACRDIRTEVINLRMSRGLMEHDYKTGNRTQNVLESDINDDMKYRKSQDVNTIITL